MKVIIIGGTGLLGSEAARELIRRGHTVSAIALPPVPSGADLPAEMSIHFANYLTMPDEQLRTCLDGCHGLVFAAGIDERVEGSAPIYDLFAKYNIEPLKRILGIAQSCDIRHFVIYGSYFSYFDKTRPKDELSRWHPYIRSRRDQEHMALSFSDDEHDIAILELPFIFGAQAGRKPVWVFLADMIRKMKPWTFFPKGGTTMVTVRQVAQATAGALEKNRGGQCYPIGYTNMAWKELLSIIHRYLGTPRKKTITIPTWLFALTGRHLRQQQKKQQIEGGLNLAKFAALQCSNQFIDRSLGCDRLGVEPDDIDRAIGDSIRASLAYLDHPDRFVEMKAD